MGSSSDNLDQTYDPAEAQKRRQNTGAFGTNVAFDAAYEKKYLETYSTDNPDPAAVAELEQMKKQYNIIETKQVKKMRKSYEKTVAEKKAAQATVEATQKLEKQKSLASRAQGRQSTILTEQSNAPKLGASTGAKTILGS